MEKIFLERNRNIKSINKENKVNLNLVQKARLLPYSNVSDALNLSELSDQERDACSRYRLIFTVNPICSNMLYNMKTEVVYREGSGEDCKALVDGFNYINRSVLGEMVTNTKNQVDFLQAIRDTEYSHPNMGGLTYHCGIDIFNNHILRSNGFNHISRMNKSTTAECGTVFNTIFDYQRDASGNVVTESLINSVNTAETKIHQYQIDNILTFDEAYEKHMKEKDGWFGFDNVGYIDIPNGCDGTKSVNRVMNGSKACEFIDMYPDRTLFSFVPKVNKYRRRTEKNWDYCITYPYQSDYEMFDEVMGRNGKNAILAKVITGKTQNGHELVVFKTMIRHNLTYGDCVRLFTENETIDIFISGVGDEKGEDLEHCFKIYAGELANLDLDIETIAVKKLSNSTGCEYYFRKFKKLKNADGSELDSNIAKLAYGENIYGDRVAEIIYTDDIVLDGLKDNRGKPLSEIFLTIVKANRGHEQWYNYNNFTDDKIEYSHCFGIVTSGIETAYDFDDYNVRKIHNIDMTDKSLPSGTINGIDVDYEHGLREVFGDMFDTPLKTLERDITVEKFDEFYGDIVEFDPSANKETVLEKVYHRFNTEQRETLNPCYFDLHYDILAGDDYDTGTYFDNTNNTSGFTVWTGLNKIWRNNAEITADNDELAKTLLNNVKTDSGYVIFPGNLQPEGYFYQAHYPIKIRQVSEAQKSEVGAQIIYEMDDTLNSYTTVIQDNKTPFIEVVTKDLYNYIIGDLFGLYNTRTGKLVWGVLDSLTPIMDAGNLDKYHLKIETNEPIELSELQIAEWEIVLSSGSMPMYASYIPKEQTFVWRDVLNPSEVDPSNSISDIMFANGANYIHTNIDFFLKRQDPFAENGLCEPKGSGTELKVNPLKKYKKFGAMLDFSKLIYLAIEAQNACL